MFFRNIRIWFERISCKSSCCIVEYDDQHNNGVKLDHKEKTLKKIDKSKTHTPKLDSTSTLIP